MTRQTNSHPHSEVIKEQDAKQGRNRFNLRVLTISMVLIIVAFGVLYLITQTVYQPEATIEEIGDQPADNADTPAASERADGN